jgi:hypothetical protein
VNTFLFTQLIIVYLQIGFFFCYYKLEHMYHFHKHFTVCGSFHGLKARVGRVTR